MKKVLILTYFFPPSTLTAAGRPQGYAQYFKDSGYYPIIVCRNWDVPISTQRDMALAAGNELRVEQHDGYEVHYLPYQPNLRDKLYAKGETYQPYLRKLLTVKELFISNYSINAVPYANLYEHCRSLLKEQPDLRKMLVVANPYTLFFFAYRLKKEFPELKWIADYRDDWNTRTQAKLQGAIHSMVHRIEAQKEKQWVGTANLVTSVTPFMAEKIEKFVGVKSEVVYNGYLEKPLQKLDSPNLKQDEFVINFTGFLYDNYEVEIFLDAFKQLVDHFKDRIKPIAQFLGLGFFDSAVKRIKAATEGYYDYLRITDYIPHQECLQRERDADMLMMMAYGKNKGIASSKSYQYMTHRKPILLVPSDHDIIEQDLREAGLGLIADTKEEAYEHMKRAIEAKLAGKPLEMPVREEMIERYSRRNQTKRMAQLLDQL